MSAQVKNLKELLSEYIGPQKKVISTNISNLTAPGENYLSLVLKIDVVLLNENGKEETLELVGKCLHSGDIDEMMKNFGKMNYKNEKAWYTEVIPTLQNFLEEKDCKINFDIFPNLIAFRSNLHDQNGEVDDDSILLMKNLTINGKCTYDYAVVLILQLSYYQYTIFHFGFSFFQQIFECYFFHE